MFKNTINIPDNKKRKFVIYTFLSLSWMILIFCFSAQVATDSSATSNGVIEMLKNLIPLDFMSLDMLQVFVRKGAHFFVYTCLSMLLFQMFSQTNKCRYAGRFAICISFLYACSDELHQSFVPGRACMFQDVCIDTSGAMLGVLVLLIGKHFIKSYQRGL